MRRKILGSGDDVSDFALAYDATLPVEAGPDEEALWVDRARQGDVDAFDVIMERYEGRLLRFLTGLVYDVEVARELCQDTFLAAYQGLPRTHGPMRLSAWLHTIALNRARSYHRKKRIRSWLPLDEERHPSAPDSQESTTERDAVQRTLARMPQNYAQPLLLQITGGLSCKEIAGVLGCTEGAVKVRLLRARESFRRIYSEEGGEV